MSEKEYKIERHGDYVTIREVDNTPIEFETNPNPTVREKLGEKIRSTSKTTKIILTLFFNVYGILYRFGCNKTTAVIFSVIHSLSTILTPFAIYSISIYYDSDPTVFVLIVPMLLTLFTYLIDIISVIATGDIVFLKMKKYKNYWER